MVAFEVAMCALGSGDIVKRSVGAQGVLGRSDVHPLLLHHHDDAV